VRSKHIALAVLLLAAGSVAAIPGSQQGANENVQQPPAPAAQAPPPRTSGTTIRVPVNLVNIIATVFTRRAKLVTDLERPEFHVFEDGKEQKIEFFARETDLPLRIGLLLDTSNSIRERLEFEKDAAIEFLHNTLRRKKDQAFLMIFDNEPAVIQNYTDDAGLLTEAVQRQRAGGGTALYDAVIRASEKLAQSPQPADNSAVRRVIVVITDGDDNLSRAPRGLAIEAAERTGVAIYSISSSTAWVSAAEYTDARKRVERKYLKGEADHVLDEFSTETGGRAFFPYSVDDLGQSFQDIGEELRSQYSLAYVPPNRPPDGKFRQIKVEVSRKGLQVRARKGYYALPSEPPAKVTPGQNE
jgi:Ca-activated chloride channel family protein